MDVSMTVNGARVPLDGRAHENLLDALRRAGLTGCKEGCAEGECGACAVLVRRDRTATPADVDGSSSTESASCTPPVPEAATEWSAVNACLIPALDLAGAEIMTSEGLSASSVHPVARSLAEAGGSQCGYCTPGFVCAAAAEFYRPSRAGGDDFDLHALSGNLCRCTGYRPIVDAVSRLGTPADDDVLASPMPAEAPQTFHVKRADGDVIKPATLDEALSHLARSGDTAEEPPRLVAGSTDHGVEVNLRHLRPPRVLLLSGVSELQGVTVTGEEIRLGAATTLHDIERALGDRVPLLAELWPQFASRLIRTRATLGGNLGTGSPIGDVAPALLALDAELILVSRTGTRRVALAEYFTGYRTSVRRADELIAEVVIQQRVLAPGGHRIERFMKVAKRRFDDISSVAIALVIDVGPDAIVHRARIAAGGVAATPLRAYEAEQAIVGQVWRPDAIARAASLMRELGTPIDDHRASAGYRRAMAEQALLKACHESCEVSA